MVTMLTSFCKSMPVIAHCTCKHPTLSRWPVIVIVNNKSKVRSFGDKQVQDDGHLYTRSISYTIHVAVAIILHGAFDIFCR